MTILEKAGSGSIEPEDFNRVVDELNSGGPAGSVTAADVDSQSAQDGDVLTADGAGGASWEAGGGSTAGAVTVRKFAIAFNSAGLYTSAGFPLFTTEAGEQILNCWAWGSVDWDAGTSPLLDCGSVAELGNQLGWYKAQGLGPLALLLVADSALNSGGESVAPINDSLFQQVIANNTSAVPRIYEAATPIVAVSWDDNLVSEDAPAPYGATAGALNFYVMSVVPA